MPIAFRSTCLINMQKEDLILDRYNGFSAFQALGESSTDPQEIADADLSSLSDYDGLIVGAPTWNTGADTERSGTGWDNLLDDIRGEPEGNTRIANDSTCFPCVF